MFIFQFLFVAIGVRYISHNRVKYVNIDGTRMSKILHTYDKIFARTLPTNMVKCINNDDLDNTPLELLIDEYASYITIKNTGQSVFLGNDMRPNLNDKEPSIGKIIELNTKHQLLTTLENNQVSMVTKTNLCDQFNKNKQSYTANLLSGGLTNDFDFDLFA